MKLFVAFSTAIVFLLSMPIHAQWVKVPPAKIPRTADGKPNPSAPAPRLPDGKPDLSGIWEPVNNRYVQNIAADLKPGEIQPWAQKSKFQQCRENLPSCFPAKVPKVWAWAKSWPRNIWLRGKLLRKLTTPLATPFLTCASTARKRS